MRKERWWWVLALGGLVALALALRLARLDAEPFWLDEICTHDFSGGTVSSVLRAWAQDVHPPLYGLLLHGWQTVAGTSESALRGYSAAWSILSLLCIVALTYDVTADRSAALAAGLFMAVNPLDIWYAREARMYAQAAALAIAGTWVLWRWLRRDEPRRGRGLLLAYGLLAALLVWTHYLGAVIVVSQALAAFVLLLRRGRWRDTLRLGAVVACAAATLLPWVAFVHRFRPGLYAPGSAGWIPRPRLAELWGYLTHELFTGFAHVPPSAAAWLPPVAAVVLAVTLVAAASTGPSGAVPKPRAKEGLALLLWLAVGPPLLAAAISVAWHPIYFRPRFSLFCLAPTVVAVVALLTRVRVPLRTFLLAAVAGLMAMGTAWQAASPTKTGLRELSHLATTFGEPEIVVLLPGLHSTLVRYYLPHAGINLSRQAVAERLSRATPAVVWVGLEGGRLPQAGSKEANLVSWLATTGPYRRLGSADGFALYEVRAGAARSLTGRASRPSE